MPLPTVWGISPTSGHWASGGHDIPEMEVPLLLMPLVNSTTGCLKSSDLKKRQEMYPEGHEGSEGLRTIRASTSLVSTVYTPY